jgi:selenide, water dikinase
MMELPRIEHPDLIVGTGTSDDAGVFRLDAETALVQTVDFFTPIVDDPFDFGRIAAANALSDVYAMGGRPLTAMNIVCFPVKEMPLEILRDILKGGLEKIQEAGAVLVGGHSVEDRELKYGLSVTGVVRPDEVLTNDGARPGDALLLTKPIGTGVLATAVKGKVAGDGALETLVRVTSTLNRAAADVMKGFEVHACTDVTGFGLAGHALEMARGARVRIVLRAEDVPVIPEARELAAMGLLPAGSYATRHYCGHLVNAAEGVDTLLTDLLFDPQTSGGLLLAVRRDQAGACVDRMHEQGIAEAAVIGEVAESHEKGMLSVE